VTNFVTPFSVFRGRDTTVVSVDLKGCVWYNAAHPNQNFLLLLLLGGT
jgi:hypothetical protein